MFEDIVRAFHGRYGEDWTGNEEANMRFSIDAEFVLRGVEGVHLIGDPDLGDDQITLSVWVDFPIRDLMTADLLAYEIFGRISEDVFYSERHFDLKSLRYQFVTGGPKHGHVGCLVLAGPHAAEFVSRQQDRLNAGVRFHA